MTLTLAHPMTSEEKHLYDLQIHTHTLTDNKMPRDHTVVNDKFRYISIWLSVTMCSLALLGLITASLLLTFNIVHRRKRSVGVGGGYSGKWWVGGEVTGRMGLEQVRASEGEWDAMGTTR